FAHRLIDGGVDVIHGHSSHHPRPVEVYRGRLVLYGCGDAINDYEGISGYEQFRGDLRLLYVASVTADTGALAALHMVPKEAGNRAAARRGPRRRPGAAGSARTYNPPLRLPDQAPARWHPHPAALASDHAARSAE